MIPDGGGCVDTVFMYCKVPHRPLLRKLEGYRLTRNVLAWIDFMSERHQRVVVNGANFEWSSVTSGIPRELGVPVPC